MYVAGSRWRGGETEREGAYLLTEPRVAQVEDG